MLKDLRIDAQNVVRLAGLSPSIISMETVQLTVEEYFRLCEATEHEAQDPLLALRMADVVSPEAFSPPVFAALCSANLQVAVERISAHKRLMAPMRVTLESTDRGMSVAWVWDDPTIRSPRLLMAMELVFMMQIARLGTRERVQPVRVGCPVPLEPVDAFADYFGVAPVVADTATLTFRTEDAHRPFLTASEAMWRTFEPELQRRLNARNAEVPLSERIRSVLLECLPGGEVSVDGAARRLGMSRRTLQRRLKEEGVAFRDLVRDVRERLSRHYLVNTALPYSEIAFLIGFDEPSSFFRAFREWTGTTPESMRLATG